MSDFLRSRKAHEKGIGAGILTDKPVEIRLRYIGAGTVTSVTVNTATDITTVTVVAGVTVTTIFDFATYATLGAIVDHINFHGEFEAKILDGLRTDALTATSELVDGAVSSSMFFGETVWDICSSTNTRNSLSYRLTADRGFEKVQNWKNAHRVHLAEIKYLATFSGAAAGTVLVYDTVYTPILGMAEERLVFQRAAANAAATTISWRNDWDKLSAREGHDLVIRIADSGTLPDAAGNYLRISGFLE